jgi:tetratricopeptide (TPR) repeat protein
VPGITLSITLTAEILAVKRFALTLALVAGLTLAGAVLQPVSARETWTSVRSKNFFLVGNASEKDIRRIGVQLEQFRDVLTRLLTNMKAASTVPITVMVFKSADSFKPFRPPASDAYFQSGEDVNYIALTCERRGEHPYSVVFHEYVHFLLRNNAERVPLWFDEGLAEYYSSFDIQDGDKKVLIGLPISNHVRSLREKKLIPLETLFAVKHDSPIYNERDKKGIFYAESWALVHYLLLGNEGKRASQFKQFIDLLAEANTVEAAFKQAFQTDFRTLERELMQYIGRDHYQVRDKTFDEKLKFDTQMQSAPLTEAQGQFYLGDLLLHTSQLDRAEKYLRQAITLDPTLAIAHASLGMLNVRRERFDEAREHLQRAVAADTKDYLVHYYYAYMLIRDQMRVGDYVTGFTPEIAQTIRQELRKSIALAPDYAESYYLLAFVNLVMDEQRAETIELLKRALTLVPGEQRFGNLLAQLYIRNHEHTSARQILEPIARLGADPKLSAQAQSLLQTISAIEEREAQALAESESTGAAAGAVAPSEREQRAPGADAASTPSAGSQPAFQQVFLPQREGEEQARGQLLSIDCDAQGITIMVKAGNRTLKLQNNELRHIRFVSFSSEMRGRIGCGPRNPATPVIVSYRAAKDVKSKTDGEVTAIAFVSTEELDAVQ